MNDTPKKNSQKIHTISILVSNKPGVLVRVALVFARRAFNIDSLVVSPTVDPKFSRMTITAQGDPGALDQIIKQTGKLIDVLHVQEHDIQLGVEKELALVKVRSTPVVKRALTRFLKKYQAQVVDSTDDALIIQQTGTTAELDEFEMLLKQYGVLELVRTGKILLMRGRVKT